MVHSIPCRDAYISANNMMKYYQNVTGYHWNVLNISHLMECTNNDTGSI